MKFDWLPTRKSNDGSVFLDEALSILENAGMMYAVVDGVIMAEDYALEPKVNYDGALKYDGTVLKRLAKYFVEERG